jgi:predicted transcriptional regulator
LAEEWKQLKQLSLCVSGCQPWLKEALANSKEWKWIRMAAVKLHSNGKQHESYPTIEFPSIGEFSVQERFTKSARAPANLRVEPSVTSVHNIL